MISSYVREAEDPELQKRRQKAQQLRYKKPIVKDICLEHVQSDLYDMQEACADIAYSTDDGDIGLLAELIGDEDEAREFQMEFSDLEAEIEQMQGDLEEEWVPECFDVFFVSIKAGEQGGGYLGWDSYEQDYFGLGVDWIAAGSMGEVKKVAYSMIKWAHGVVHGSTSAEYHCECGGYLCIRPIGMLERYPGPMSCPQCGALMDWRQAIEWQRIIADERKD